MSRRDLFGVLRRAPEPAAAPEPEPAPAPEPAAFSLDGFYRDRAPAKSLPVFTVRVPERHPTTRVGAGPLAAATPPAERTRADAPPAIAVAADQVPRVLDSACLATRSFCSVCVERCPRPGAIIVEHGRPRVVPASCDGCGHCIAVCPAPILAFVLVGRTPAVLELADA
jgi:Pyruvate/2-oxoacid:ferredoxin oxidoreductase delta subunit